MQPLKWNAMRSLIILLFFAAVRGIEIPLKNGVLDVNRVNDKLMIVTLKQNDGENMVNLFYTRTQTANPAGISFNYDPERQTAIITRTITEPDGELLDCFQLTDGTQWFGGPQLRYQHWPVQNMYYEEEPYLPTHPKNMAIAERYWLSGKGIYIYVDEKSPLFLDQNNYRDKYLCMIAKNKAPYQHRNTIVLNYTLGVFNDPKTAHQHAVQNYLGRPEGHPNERMIRYPIWSTWARYKTKVSEKVVETYANEIVEHGFSNSQIEIDDNWESCYGSAKFDAVKFPDVSGLVQRLKSKGFRVTLWIHPFINRGCEPAYSEALNNNYFVKNLDGNVQMSWWQGSDAATIDFTNLAAVNWWMSRLKRLQKLGIDSFKFDAGETSWLPQVSTLNASLELQPSIFTQEYVRVLADNFDDNIEVRVGWRSQKLPIFVRMIDKDTRWTWNNGLPTLITTLLQMNLNGYVHVLPDMIGGNGYLNGLLNRTELPSKEIFIRWLQTNVFMPSLQYSFVPWDFDDQTIELCKKYTEMHDFYTSHILNAMQEAIDNGTPVNPPIWWVDPTDNEAQKINDEYLLGESILVAPVIEEGVESRDIYLPKGWWLDMNRKTVYEGPRWVRNYAAPIEVLPYFMKTTPPTTTTAIPTTPTPTTPAPTTPAPTTPAPTTPAPTTPAPTTPAPTTPAPTTPAPTTPAPTTPAPTTPAPTTPAPTTPAPTTPAPTTPAPTTPAPTTPAPTTPAPTTPAPTTPAPTTPAPTTPAPTTPAPTTPAPTTPAPTTPAPTTPAPTTPAPTTPAPTTPAPTTPAPTTPAPTTPAPTTPAPTTPAPTTPAPTTPAPTTPAPTTPAPTTPAPTTPAPTTPAPTTPAPTTPAPTTPAPTTPAPTTPAPTTPAPTTPAPTTPAPTTPAPTTPAPTTPAPTTPAPTTPAPTTPAPTTPAPTTPAPTTPAPTTPAPTTPAPTTPAPTTPAPTTPAPTTPAPTTLAPTTPAPTTPVPTTPTLTTPTPTSTTPTPTTPITQATISS